MCMQRLRLSPHCLVVRARRGAVAIGADGNDLDTLPVPLEQRLLPTGHQVPQSVYTCIDKRFFFVDGNQRWQSMNSGT